MPFTEGFPFRRLGVDHMVLGVTKVWWELDRNFRDPGPYSYQLQLSRSGVATSTDWVNVGSAAENVGELQDDDRHLYGKRLHSFYRVVVTTGTRQYVSKIVAAGGELQERDWVFARELVRKEQLRLREFAGREGYLLRRIRYGEQNTANRDELLGDVLDARDRTDYGTGFKGGYFAPVPMQCWDLSPESIVEVRNADSPPGQGQATQVTARALGMPTLNREDVWVDAKNDKRWWIEAISHQAEVRGVPVIVQITMHLLPFTHVVYRFPVGSQSPDVTGEDLPTSGSGSVSIDHDYTGEDALAYHTEDGCGVVGATIRAYLKSAYDAGGRDAVAASSTGANGRWAFAMLLDPGEYVLIFEKPGEYGPNGVAVTVVADSSSSSPSSDSGGMGPQ